MFNSGGPLITFFFFFLLQLIIQPVCAQSGLMQIGDMKADSATITAIAIYPQEIRKNILQACLAPEALVKMDNMQKESSAKFKSALAPYSKDVQKKIYDLARYPGLIKALDGSDRKRRKDLDKIAEEYPEEIRETIKDYGRKYYDLYVELSKIESDAENEFSALLKTYPDKQATALREITKRPEIVNLLNSDMRSAVVAGDLYKRNPQWLNSFLDSLAADNAQQNAKALEDWKAGLEKNPEAKKQFEQASKEYAKQQGRDESEYAPVTENIQVNYYAYPYPYWYGYPWWYNYPYWYETPLWYDWGYYYGPAGWVYMGYPSPYFMHWYFHHPHHHYVYYQFTDYCVGHYHGTKFIVTPFNQQVQTWMKTTSKEVPKEFFKPDAERPVRIREYGKLSSEYNNYMRQNPGQPVNKIEYVNANREKYPHIAKQIEATPVNTSDQIKPQQDPNEIKPKEQPKEVKPVQQKPVLKKRDEDKPAIPQVGEQGQPQQPVQQKPVKEQKPVTPPVNKPQPVQQKEPRQSKPPVQQVPKQDNKVRPAPVPTPKIVPRPSQRPVTPQPKK